MFTIYNRIDELPAGTNKGQLIAEIYPDDQYNVDTAIPLAWLDDAFARGMDKYAPGALARHFCTVYPRDGSPSFIGPLTVEGVEILARLATVKQ